MKKNQCPSCNKPINLDKENPFKPFCSEKCKLIDLGSWLSERYSIQDENSEVSELEKNQELFNKH